LPGWGGAGDPSSRLLDIKTLLRHGRPGARRQRAARARWPAQRGLACWGSGRAQNAANRPPTIAIDRTDMSQDTPENAPEPVEPTTP
ncbi:hypothetical protein COE41_29770, partial [Bacillus thuringiensis]